MSSEVSMTGRSTKMRRLVYGFGVNDADYVTNVLIDGKLVTCPIYRRWKGMIERCYSQKWLERAPTYAGCSVADDWHSFMSFRQWMLKQEWEGKHLDKDLLNQGNKVYSPASCLFLEPIVNTFVNDQGAKRGMYPIGVCLQGTTGKFRAKCRNPLTGKQESLGDFACPDAAHAAWVSRKTQLAAELAATQSDVRVRFALLRYDFSMMR